VDIVQKAFSAHYNQQVNNMISIEPTAFSDDLTGSNVYDIDQRRL